MHRVFPVVLLIRTILRSDKKGTQKMVLLTTKSVNLLKVLLFSAVLCRLFLFQSQKKIFGLIIKSDLLNNPTWFFC